MTANQLVPAHASTAASSDPAHVESANKAWDEVLSAVEEDVRRTAAMLAEPIRLSDAVAGYVAPAQALLPTGGPRLPPLDEMPAVPVELTDRIRDLRVRIGSLQAELRTALAAMQSASQSASHSAVPSSVHSAALAPFARTLRPIPLAGDAPAHFFDSRV